MSQIPLQSLANGNSAVKAWIFSSIWMILEEYDEIYACFPAQLFQDWPFMISVTLGWRRGFKNKANQRIFTNSLIQYRTAKFGYRLSQEQDMWRSKLLLGLGWSLWSFPVVFMWWSEGFRQSQEHHDVRQWPTRRENCGHTQDGSWARAWQWIIGSRRLCSMWRQRHISTAALLNDFTFQRKHGTCGRVEKSLSSGNSALDRWQNNTKLRHNRKWLKAIR
jgi:hypothetical protein